MRVLVLSQHFWPETFRINDVTALLHRSGICVSALTGQPNYPGGAIFPGYRSLDASIHQHPLGYPIYRVPLVPRGPGGARRLVVNYVSFLVSACVLGSLFFCRGKRFDVIFVYGSSPILQAIVGIVLKSQVKAALVTWVQDLWPQSLEATGFIRNRYVLGAVGALVKWIYRRSDLLLVQSPAFLEPVRSMAKNTPVVYHPNPSPAEEMTTRCNETPPGPTLAQGFNVVFAGNLGTVQALDTILVAAELLLTEPDIRFTLVGSGSREEWVRSEIRRRGLTNIDLPGRFPPEVMPSIFAQASVLLVSLARSPIMALTVPSKVQAYLAAGRPIIAALDGEGARVVLEAGAGIACPAEDAPSLAQAVLSLRATAPQTLAKMGVAGRAYHAKHFSPQLLTERLIGHFHAVAARRSRWACVN
jgi:glycosyltransferase involved in cell wall biosynthesis